MIKLGIIVNTRGLKGEVKIDSCTSFGKLRYSKNNEIIAIKDNNKIILHPTSYSSYKGFDYVMFEEINSINIANNYKNYELFIDEKYINKLENGYYYYELLNLNVYSQNNEYLGRISEVFDNPSNTIIRVSNNTNEFLVPFVDAFIISVDLKESKIIINDMEGLR